MALGLAPFSASWDADEGLSGSLRNPVLSPHIWERRGQQVFLKPDEPPPQPCADSLQPARTPLHRSQNPQGVETTDWRMLC
uniref:Phosphodiesterase 2A, cGMP-stimulated n=1 Tax=Mus musculus TaxID=10090 RepID=A0A1B0GSC8_MOUSE